MAVLSAGCGASEEASEAPQNSSPPPAESAGEPMTLDPSDPQPGQGFFAFFDESNSRGGYFLPYRWDGSSWGDPLFVLQSDAGGRVASAESLGGGGEGTGTDDYGIDGVGPDGLLAPDDMRDGFWRLCTANAADHACVQFRVDQSAS